MSYRRGNLGSLSTNKTPEETRHDIDETFRKWGIEEYRIPRNERGNVGPATVLFYVNDQKQALTCSRFYEYRDNLRAIYLILDSLRLAQERGILSELARAAVAMLGPGQTAVRSWYEVLDVSPRADPDVVKASFQALARKRHPDAGGSNEAMTELNRAYEEFQRQSGVPA